MNPITEIDIDYLKVLDLAAMVKIFSNQLSLDIIKEISRKKISVSDLSAKLGERKQKVSMQLGKMKAAGVVVSVKDGRYKYYRPVMARIVMFEHILDIIL